MSHHFSPRKQANCSSAPAAAIFPSRFSSGFCISVYLSPLCGNPDMAPGTHLSSYNFVPFSFWGLQQIPELWRCRATSGNTKQRQTALMVRKTTILSLTSRFDVTSLSSCLLKKDLGLLKERYVQEQNPSRERKYWVRDWLVHCPPTHNPPPFFLQFFLLFGGKPRGGQCSIQTLPLKPPPQELQTLGEFENRTESGQKLHRKA